MTTTTKSKFSPKMVRIFEECDGWHYCAAGLDYLDARGTGYPSAAAAMRAARESHEDQLELRGTSIFSKE